MDYDFGNKKQYRRNIWAFVDRHCTKPIVDRKVLYLDTAKGGETLFLLNKGYKAENLFIVNFDENELLKLGDLLQSLKVGHINLCPMSIEHAVIVMSKAGHFIDVYNFDFMSNITNDMVRDTLRTTARIISKDCIVGVNVLRGREAKWFKERRKEDNPDWIRELEIKSSLSYDIKDDEGEEECITHIIRQRNGIYKSSAGRQTMMWFVFKVMKHCVIDIGDLEDHLSKETDIEHGDIPQCYSSMYRKQIDDYVCNNLMRQVNENISN